MCGILGYSHVTNRLPDRVLSNALAALAHRGPDQQGHFASDSVSLGATRLRILDMAGGDQPLISPDGNVVMVFNGEIFNHHEVREELRAKGYRFESRCDTEVVLYAFLEWGTGCFARLRGMFGVAVWVQSERRLVLARDRMGIKPVYYCEHQGEIYFASELKCIFAHPEVPRRISLDGLNCFLRLNYVPAPYTLVEGIHKLFPGHMLEWRNGRATVESYVPQTASGSRPRSLEDACEELDTLLAASVREQLVSDVPVGIWLSGGLDSSTVLSYASQASSSPLRTFSITFRGRSFDESDSISQITRHFGSLHEELNLDESLDLEAAIRQIAFYSDEPSADAGALPAWFLAQMTARKVTVVLSGEGADELFAGYLTYKADRYAAWGRRVPSWIRSAGLELAGLLPVSDDKISFEYKLKRFLRGSLLSPEQAHIYWNGTFTEEEKRQFFRYPDPAPIAQVVSEMKNFSGLERFLQFDQRYYLADDILYKVDRMSMAHSLEARPPYLDPRIVDFAAQLPEKFKLNGSRSKFILRELMKDKLPPGVLQRPKIGFDIPVHDWFRGVLRPLLLETLSQEAVTSTELFRWSGVKRLLHDHLERRANLGYHLWGLMVLLLWMKEWRIEPPLQEMRTGRQHAEAFDPVGSF
ncbi:MAG TPA: asparagine synthase (glutamine-hydrolyzing) [Candidatus Angelobacter sp.]|jgi:asparagine synthase (glutamine-hydrolysing)|nr:asparagine synthase (glutamine-hydrolyzing) [Candidatus Angelobacter sp.]